VSKKEKGPPVGRRGGKRRACFWSALLEEKNSRRAKGKAFARESSREKGEKRRNIIIDYEKKKEKEKGEQVRKGDFGLTILDPGTRKRKKKQHVYIQFQKKRGRRALSGRKENLSRP